MILFNRSQVVWLCVALVLISAASIVVYYPSFRVPFVFDDIAQVRGTDHTVSWTWSRFLGRRSIPHFTFDLNVWVGGLAVVGFHLTNLIIHIVASLTVFLLSWVLAKQVLKDYFVTLGGRKVSATYLSALLAALVFAVHPLQTQAVTYIVQRITLFGALFYFLALLAYVLYRQTRRTAWAVASLATTVLAMHSKEIAMTIPLAIILLEVVFFTPRREQFLRAFRRLLPWLLTLIIIPASIMGLTQRLVVEPQSVLPEMVSLEQFQRITTQSPDLSRWDYFITQWNVMRSYVRLLLVPVGQNIDHDFPVTTTIWNFSFLLSWLLVASLLATVAWLFKRGQRLAATGIIFFFLALLPESSFFPLDDRLVEHRLYLPMLGVAFVVTTVVHWLLQQKFSRVNQSVLIALLLVVIMSAGVATWQRNQLWQDPVKLWSDSVAKSPRKARPYNNLGVSYILVGKLDEGLKAYQQAIALDPEYPDAHSNLGSAYGQRGELDLAIKHVQRAIELEPQFITAYNNLGVAYFQKQRYEDAARAYEKALEINPNYVSPYINLGRLYTIQKRYDEAITLYEKALTINPNQADVYNDLAVIYWQRGEPQRARGALDRALQLNPDHIMAQKNLRILTEPHGALQLLR